MPSPVAVIIPARFASSRFPGKMLLDETLVVFMSEF